MVECIIVIEVKGILDRQFAAQSVVLRKDMTYSRVLEKCITIVFSADENVQESCEYYIANGRGMSICNDDHICVDNVDGEEEHITWTLQTYINLSSIRGSNQRSDAIYIRTPLLRKRNTYEWHSDTDTNLAL